MKLADIVSIASDTIKDRITALNFERRSLQSARVFFHSRVPGSNTPPATNGKPSSPSITVFLPHSPAAEGLWSNSLVASGQIDFCSLLPQIEQRLRLSTDHMVILTPSSPLSASEDTLASLERYKNQILDLCKGLLKDYSQVNALCYGFGGAALVLAMSTNPDLRNQINKISFIDCEESVTKALAATATTGDKKGDNFWQASPVAKVLERRSIMFKLDEAPIWSIIKDAKEAGCSCPVVSIGTLNQDEIMFQGGAMGITYFRKMTPSLSKPLLVGVVALVLVLLTVLLLLTYKQGW